MKQKQNTEDQIGECISVKLAEQFLVRPHLINKANRNVRSADRQT